jgi:hypothetical protein
MTRNSQLGRGASNASQSLLGIRDLIDFHLKWHSFRDKAVAISQDANLSDSDRELVIWLIRLCDRVGERDLIQ